MTRINTNVAALRAINRLRPNVNDLDVRLERLSTGLRINRGRDDPAGLIVSELLRSEIRSTEQAISNSTRASNVISTAESALNEVSTLLLDLQGLVVSSANQAGLTDSEVKANQLAIDSILDSVDRIGNTTQFAGKRLLDGSQDYLLSSIPSTALDSISVFSARLSPNTTRDVTVQVTQSARTAQLSFLGANSGGTSTTSATTIEIKGTLGVKLLSFASGTSLAQVRNAINNQSNATGVSAIVSAPSAGTAASAILLNSTTVGSDAFVSVEPFAGNFVSSSAGSSASRAIGVDTGVIINGQTAAVSGLRADVRAGGIDARIYLAQSFAQTLSSASFSLAGGGSIFQLAPDVNPNGQLFAGFGRVASTTLGNSVSGLLYTLRSGAGNDLSSKNFQTAQGIINEAIDQVSSQRGRLGTLQRNHIEPNINAQSVAVENVTASESVIRDADMAVEISALTRAQILVQSTQNVLQIANSVPNLVLSLLS